MTTKQASLVPEEDRAEAHEHKEESGLAVVIERLAANPQVDVQKLEKIIELQGRILEHTARAAFNEAFSRMQAEIPEIDEKGGIRDRQGEIQSTYARNE